MKRVDELNKAYREIECFRSKLGEVLYDAIQEDDNYIYEIARSVSLVFCRCKTDKEVEIADAMLIAICGYGIQTLISEIEERDANNYNWLNY